MKWEQARFECRVKNPTMCEPSNCDVQEGGVEGLLLHEQVIEKVIVRYPPFCFVIEVLEHSYI